METGDRPAKMCCIIVFPARLSLTTLFSSIPCSRHISRIMEKIWLLAQRQSSSSPPWFSIMYLTLEITSAPYLACLFHPLLTPASFPSERRHSFATTVVVPRSTAAPYRDSLDAPSSTEAEALSLSEKNPVSISMDGPL